MRSTGRQPPRGSRRVLCAYDVGRYADATKKKTIWDQVSVIAFKSRTKTVASSESSCCWVVNRRGCLIGTSGGWSHGRFVGNNARLNLQVTLRVVVRSAGSRYGVQYSWKEARDGWKKKKDKKKNTKREVESVQKQEQMQCRCTRTSTRQMSRMRQASQFSPVGLAASA